MSAGKSILLPSLPSTGAYVLEQLIPTLSLLPATQLELNSRLSWEFSQKDLFSALGRLPLTPRPVRLMAIATSDSFIGAPLGTWHFSFCPYF